jgi:hypothetical protein
MTYNFQLILERHVVHFKTFLKNSELNVTFTLKFIM